jgi:hypothetical protein
VPLSLDVVPDGGMLSLLAWRVQLVFFTRA